MKNYILDAATAAKKLERMAYEIVEENIDESSLLLVGIRESGSVIARNIQQLLAKISSIPTQLVTLSLDKRYPYEVTPSEPIDTNDKVVIVIDDVANSGRTMLYALKPLLEQLPKKIQTLALVERTHKTFPIEVDYIGYSVSTTLDEHICVEVEAGEVTGAWMN